MKIVNNFNSINIFAKSDVSDACVCGNQIPSWLSQNHLRYHKKYKTLILNSYFSKFYCNAWGVKG